MEYKTMIDQANKHYPNTRSYWFARLLKKIIEFQKYLRSYQKY